MDDLIATGGTIQAVAAMMEKSGSQIAGIFAILSFPFLGDADKIERHKMAVLHEYRQPLHLHGNILLQWLASIINRLIVGSNDENLQEFPPNAPVATKVFIGRED